MHNFLAVGVGISNIAVYLRIVHLGGKERKRFGLKPKEIIGRIIEVECMEVTKNNKFRHARKKRIRWDKEK